jgi:hypothetical protein
MLHESVGYLQRLQRAVDAARAGTLIWHVEGDRLEADARALDLLKAAVRAVALVTKMSNHLRIAPG